MMVGSHNSSAYIFNEKVDLQFNRPAPNMLNHFRKISMTHSETSKNIRNFMKTQEKSIDTQIKCGCQVLDIKISRTAAREYYGSHIFATLSIDLIFKQIMAAINKHPKLNLTILIRKDHHNCENLNSFEEEFGCLMYCARQLNHPQITCYCDFSNSVIELFPYIKRYNSLDEIFFDVSTVDDFKDRMLSLNGKDLSNSILYFVLTCPEEYKNKKVPANFLSWNSKININNLIHLLKTSRPKFILFDNIDTNLILQVKYINYLDSGGLFNLDYFKPLKIIVKKKTSHNS